VTIRTCLRCGSTELQNGFIYDYRQPVQVQMTFHWKPESTVESDSIPLFAILCKSCGHIELIANTEIFIPPTIRACPHCKATYSYRIKEELSPTIVRCANCGKEFKIHSAQTAVKSDGLIDEIEKDLLEE